MTASRSKRLGQLEQFRRVQLREQTERAAQAMTAEQREGLGWYVDVYGTPAGEAAVSRLIAWAEHIPEIQGAPDLGKVAQVWWKKVQKRGEVEGLPPAAPEVSAELETYSRQWSVVAARPDCPEPEAARGFMGIWSWWAALARESRGETGKV